MPTSNTPMTAVSLFARKSEIIRQFIRKHARRLAGEGGHDGRTREAGERVHQMAVQKLQSVLQGMHWPACSGFDPDMDDRL